MQASDLNNGDSIISISTVMISTIRFCSAALFLHFLKSLLITVSCQPHSIHLFPSHFSPALSNSHVSVHASFFRYLVCENTGFSTFNRKMYWKPNPLKKVRDSVCILYPFSTILCSRDIWHFLYNTAGLGYQLFLKCHHRINKYISNFLYLFLAGNLRDKLSTSKHRYK